MIDVDCADAYAAYERDLASHYRKYFRKHPELASEHPLKARDLAAALPPGRGLAHHLPARLRHRHHLSGRSSQVLALGLLGSAATADPTLRWLFTTLGLPPAGEELPRFTFERELDPATLGEEPRVTSIDLCVETSRLVVCVEAKWSEAGLGTCSCRSGAAAEGHCAERVLRRSAYWETSRSEFQLPTRQRGNSCPISVVYQGVRNVAAALALASPDRRPVFALLYDERNPYFRPTGRWPGWPDVLSESLHGRVSFRAVSWQRLVATTPLAATVASWAREKHQLPVAGS